MAGVDTWPGHREGQLEHMPTPTVFREKVRPSQFSGERPQEPYAVPSPKQSIPVVLSHAGYSCGSIPGYFQKRRQTEI